MIHILIVDDDRDIRDTLAEAFIAFGHSVNAAKNGIHALEIFKYTHLDIALVDVEMPEMNGFELTEEIKKIKPEFPVILFTGYSHLYKPQDVLSLDVEAFLRKPLNIPELIKIVNQIIAQKRNSQE